MSRLAVKRYSLNELTFVDNANDYSVSYLGQAGRGNMP